MSCLCFFLMIAVGAVGKTRRSWLPKATVLDTDTNEGVDTLWKFSAASVVAL